jgi:5-aminopentanamidase
MAATNPPRTLRVALCQAPSKRGEVQENLATLEAYVARHSSTADLAVFPECFVGGYGYKDESKQFICEPAQGPSFQFISEVARKFSMAIVYGFAELFEGVGADGQNEAPTKFIAMNWVSAEGSLLFTYRKSHLWTPSPFESENFQRNSSSLSPIVEICGVKVGCLICFDVEVVEPARCLALNGAELLLVIGANQDPFTLECTVRVRAFENMCHLIYCNQMEYPLIGSSAAVYPTGAFIPSTPLQKGVPDEVVVVIQPDAEEWKRAAERNPLFAVRQPSLYSALVEENK